MLTRLYIGTMQRGGGDAADTNVPPAIALIHVDINTKTKIPPYESLTTLPLQNFSVTEPY